LRANLPTRASNTMVAKRQIKQEFVRHPFTKQKLRVIDTFEPNDSPSCPVCKTGTVKEIKVIESEYRGGVRYNIIACNTCEEPVWVVPS
jgi:hypothetical protein